MWKDELAMSFGITKDQLRQLINSCSFAAGKDFSPLIDTTWQALNPDGGDL